jgi:translation initiation factor 2 gamma subunit (eIF-2gamma)
MSCACGGESCGCQGGGELNEIVRAIDFLYTKMEALQGNVESMKGKVDDVAKEIAVLYRIIGKLLIMISKLSPDGKLTPELKDIMKILQEVNPQRQIELKS